MPCCVVLCDSVCAVSCRAVPCCVMSCRVVSCRAVPCRAMSCRVVSCRVVLCCPVFIIRGVLPSFDNVILFQSFTTYQIPGCLRSCFCGHVMEEKRQIGGKRFSGE